MNIPPLPLYPVFLSLAGLRCLVVGLGAVGRRKLEGLLACGPSEVLVLDTAAPGPEAAPLLRHAAVRFECRACRETDISGRALVYAATSSTGENRRIARLCAVMGIWCNCATSPGLGSFLVPSVARRPPLAAALSTAGASPALARRWKGELEGWLSPRAGMARIMGRLRPLVLALGDNQGHNASLFRSLADSPLADMLAAGDLEACRRCLRELLPASLHDHIAELLHDLP